MKKLIILRGLPGSGKTTLANFMALEMGGVAISADDYWYMIGNGEYAFDIDRLFEAHAYCQVCVGALMRNMKGIIIVHNTSTSEKELKPYLTLAAKYGYEVTSLVVENRHGNASVHNVPKETITRMAERLYHSIKLGE